LKNGWGEISINYQNATDPEMNIESQKLLSNQKRILGMTVRNNQNIGNSSS